MSNTAESLSPHRLVHVVSNDPHLGKVVERVVAEAAPNQTSVVRRQAQMPALAPEDLLILDEPGAADSLALPSGVPAIVVTDRDAAGIVRLLAANPELSHVVGRSGPFFPRLLRTTLQQIVEGDAWRFSTYLTSGAPVQTQVLTESSAKQACVDRIVAMAAGTTAFSELPGTIGTVAYELLMNAFFNAPFDFASQRRKYKDRPRHELLSLGRDEAVTVAYGHDDELLAVSIRDNFGSLSRATMLMNLERAARIGSAQIRMKTQGAGVGFYIALSSTTALEIRINPQVSTEIVAAFALTKRYRDFEQLGRSINFHLSKSGGVP